MARRAQEVGQLYNTSGMEIVSKARRDLRLLRDSPQGQRFRDRYQRRQACRSKRSKLALAYKPVYLGLGTLVFLFGRVMFPLPGPGWAICLLGLGLVAGEYEPVARLLDDLKMLIRGMHRKLKGFGDRG